ncbi:hypothetical protein NO263_14500 [Gluconacetobacter entanii]|uniref:Uncharacterized protein n=1 Tax=Gluconacetobacter entanii TaxID=108528 RepID=A0ABT3K8N0_9PROT|nr:hypothetical protein [Gluconacetobacter entanii]MCE2579726.1 hypothetical protein [Komagataeibacter sp. FNDCR1]MCW4581292.1 hypothetical protein [Gluconacetobacter entanii]MCW4584569.1 hypothetical protein [Gluconacetobacter entanii]MCW4587983.1 hypothetical protein [Gluconacetobacter entanii]MCW4591792.1 hypothetical protein [Gluconacetobacter entanii]
MPVKQRYWKIAGCVAVGLLPVLLSSIPAMAQEDEDDAEFKRHQSMHQLSRHPPLPRLHMDYSQYRFIPPGDKVKEQPDVNRLLFWTQHGTPDGYAERHGGAIVYYDSTGKAIRVDNVPATPNR